MLPPTSQAVSQTQHLQRLLQSSTARPSHAHVLTAPHAPTLGSRQTRLTHHQQVDAVRCRASATAAAPVTPQTLAATVQKGHAALLHGLGDVGNVKPGLMPWLLRLAHIRFVTEA